MSAKKEGEIEYMPRLRDREHTPQASIHHVHFDIPDTYHIYADSPEMSSEPSGSGNVEGAAGNTMGIAGRADAGVARSVSLNALSLAHTSHNTIRPSLGARAYA